MDRFQSSTPSLSSSSRFAINAGDADNGRCRMFALNSETSAGSGGLSRREVRLEAKAADCQVAQCIRMQCTHR